MDKDIREEERKREEEKLLNKTEDEDKQSATGSQSSGTSVSLVLTSNFRNFESLDNNSSMPKSLKLVVQLLFILLSVSIVIASINLAFSVSNKQQSVATVNVLRKAIDRINFTSNCRLITRSLIDIANGYEANESPILPDRFSHYRDQLSTTVN